MQTEVPTLPVVHISKNVNRKQNPDLKSASAEIKTVSPRKNSACLSSNRKCLHPLLGGPYRSNVRPHPLSDLPRHKSSIGERVLSVKMLKLKELQNQLADAHYHLNELANENRLLKALQKRQDCALKRYEGANAELPRIINSHHEELRVLQVKYKKLKALHKETCDILKEKESELKCMQSQNRHLIQLSKDRNLGEREKLQLQVSDLNHRIQQQQENIQALHRKLTIESKSLKHQLHAEISKRKETQKNLKDTVEKLKSLENLLDNRERRLYYSGQLPSYNKARLGTQSLTNLRDVSTSHALKIPEKDTKLQKDNQKDNLPLLNVSESNDAENVHKPGDRINSNEISDFHQTETMASLQQIRKFRLQKSSHIRRSSSSLDDLEPKETGIDTKVNGNSNVLTNSSTLQRLSRQYDEDIQHREIKANEFRKIFENRTYKNFSELSDEINPELQHSSDETDSEIEDRDLKSNYYMNAAKDSRQLHTRLINNVSRTSDLEDLTKPSDLLENDERIFEKLLTKKLTFSDSKYKGKLQLPVQHIATDFYESDPELSELRNQFNMEYSLRERKKEQESISPTYNEQSCFKSDEYDETSTDLNRYEISDEIHSNYLSQSKKVCQNLLNDIDANAEVHSTENTYFGEYPTENDINQLRYELQHINEERADTNILVQKARRSPSDLNKHLFNRTATSKLEFKDSPMGQDALSNEQPSEILHTNDHQKMEITYNTSQTMKESLQNQSENTLPNEETEQNNIELKIASTTELSNDVRSDEKRLSSTIESNEDKRSSPSMCLNDIRARNEINIQNVPIQENKDAVPNDEQFVVHQVGQDHNVAHNVSVAREDVGKSKVINYNKEKLLATMKAIDDNENIEFLNQEYNKHNLASRKQITENLFRGLPTQTKRKQDIIKEIFETDNMENKPRSSCSKLH